MTTPHTPKTLAKYVAELRQKVHNDGDDHDNYNSGDNYNDFDDDDAPHSKTLAEHRQKMGEHT